MYFPKKTGSQTQLISDFVQTRLNYRSSGAWTLVFFNSASRCAFTIPERWSAFWKWPWPCIRLQREPLSLQSEPQRPNDDIYDLIVVLDLVSQFRDVVLMNVYLDLEDPGGAGILGWGVYGQGEGNGKISLRATWEQGGLILSQPGGFQVSKEGQTGSKRGAEKG
jgi:hypothetical protein